MITKNTLWLLVLGTCLFLFSCAGNSEISPETESLSELAYTQELQVALDQVLYTGQGNQDLGISAAVSLPGLQTWVGTSGNSQPGLPIEPEMLFDAGSIAKNFEAALTLKLAEQGIFNLDDPISKWLPEYRNVDSAITIRQLLDHTSGIYNVFEHPEFPWVGPDVDYAKSWEIDQVFKKFVLEPYGSPGDVQHYSSTNYLLVTVLIEKVTGESIPNLMERIFIIPLGLESTVFSMGDSPPENYPVAHPWVDTDMDGDLEDLYGIPLTWKVTLSHPVIFTAPEDLTIWLNAIYRDQSVLTPSMLDEMLTFPDTHIPDPGGAKYGLGVVDYSELLEMHVYGHAGSSLGYSAAALYLPEYGASVAWLINTGESPTELADELMIGTWSALSEVIIEYSNLTP